MPTGGAINRWAPLSGGRKLPATRAAIACWCHQASPGMGGIMRPSFGDVNTPRRERRPPAEGEGSQQIVYVVAARRGYRPPQAMGDVSVPTCAGPTTTSCRHQSASASRTPSSRSRRLPPHTTRNTPRDLHDSCREPRRSDSASRSAGAPGQAQPLCGTRTCPLSRGRTAASNNFGQQRLLPDPATEATRGIVDEGVIETPSSKHP